MLIHRRTLSIFLTAALLTTVAMAQGRKRADPDSPDQKELYNYVLTMDKVQRFGSVMKSFQEYSKQHPELNEERSSDAKNLDDMAQKLQKYPEVVAMLSKNGFTPREYAICAMTLMQAGMAVGFKKSGTYKEYPPQMVKLVSKQNLDFVEQHWDAVQKATKTDSDNQ